MASRANGPEPAGQGWDTIGGPDREEREDELGGPDRPADRDTFGGPDREERQDELGGPDRPATTDTLGTRPGGVGGRVARPGLAPDRLPSRLSATARRSRRSSPPAICWV